jgi:DNA sulfur modification protein DndD
MQALGGAIKSLLGLDLAERLVADASVLEGRLAKRAVESVELVEVREWESQYEARQSEIDRLVREVGTLENHRQRAAARVQEVEEHFAKVGGRHWESRGELLQRRGELQQSLREAESRLVNLAATDLPLALVPDLLSAVYQRAAVERQAAESEVIVRLLAERDAELVTLLRVIGLVSEFLEADRAQRGTLTPALSRGERGERDRLRLSDGASQLLDRFLASGRADRQADARQQLEAMENVRRAFEDVERSLAATPDEATIGSVVEELKAATAELAGFDS